MEWVTRAGVKTDRASMIWLIRRFIDPDAKITILPADEVLAYAEAHGATPFHHPDVELRHKGTRTGFDALRTHFELTDPALAVMTMVLRGAQTPDKSLTQWSPGLTAVTFGLRQMAKTDEEFIEAAQPVIESLYQWCQAQLAPDPKAGPDAGKRH